MENNVSEINGILNDGIKKDFLRDFATFSDKEAQGVTYTWNSDNTECSVQGTATGNTARTNLYAGDTLPDGMSEGETYYVWFDATDVGINLEFYWYLDDSDKNLEQFVTKSGLIVVPKNVEKLLLRIIVKNGVTVNGTVKKVGISKYIPILPRNPYNFKAMTYNVGRYNYGYVPSEEHPLPSSSTIINKMLEFLRTHNIDLLALQENMQDIGDSKTIDGSVYDYFYPNKINYGTGANPSLRSKFNFVGTGTITFTDNDRPTVWASVEIDGRVVFVISTHLSTDPLLRTPLYAEIKDIVDRYDYFIILADFNAGNGITDWDAQPEYDLMKGYGWNTANGGIWGLLSTYAAYDETNTRYLDSIVTSPNIIINTVDAPYMRQELVSDHRPLLADLTIY